MHQFAVLLFGEVQADVGAVVEELLVVGGMNCRRAKTKRNGKGCLWREVGPGGRVHVEGLVSPADRNELAAAVFKTRVGKRKFAAPVFDVVVDRQNEVGMNARLHEEDLDVGAFVVLALDRNSGQNKGGDDV